MKKKKYQLLLRRASSHHANHPVTCVHPDRAHLACKASENSRLLENDRRHKIIARLRRFFSFFFHEALLWKSGNRSHTRARNFSSLYLSLILLHELVQGDTNLGSPICSRGVVWFGRPSACTDSRIFACRPVRRALCVLWRDAEREHKIYAREILLVRHVNAEARASVAIVDKTLTTTSVSETTILLF